MLHLRNVGSIILLTILLFGCKKHQGNKLSGTYRCTVEQRDWNMSTGAVNSNYEKDIDITQDRDFLKILEEYVHSDSLTKNKLYTKVLYGGKGVFEVQFIDKNIYIYQKSNGLGGGVEFTYRGEKIK